MAPLTGQQKKLLIHALSSAYPNYRSLGGMLALELDKNLATYAAEGRLPNVLLDVITYAEAEGWIEELVTGAALGNPGNPELKQLIASGLLHRHKAVRRAIDDPTGTVQELLPQAAIFGHGVGAELQRVVNIAAGFQDVIVYATRLLEQAGRVCCIKIVVAGGKRFSGTGVLVGPDLVLTNHHVLEGIIDGPGSPTGAQFVFDYYVAPDGTVNHGTPFGLAPTWLEAASPPSVVDTQAAPTALPGPNELDYALVRLAGRPGLMRMPDGRERGWVDLLAAPPAVAPGLPLLIVQHPDEHPMQVALDTRGVLTVNDNDTRLTYGVNTLGGASGSPCFTLDLALAALHHAGRKESTTAPNEGIPIAAIAQHLRDGGHAAKLGG